MSWYTDPELFIYCRGRSRVTVRDYYGIFRITKKHNVPLLQGDLTRERLDFSVHLGLGKDINLESDFDALRSILVNNCIGVNREKVMMVNCQGWVVYWNYSTSKGVWSREEEIDSIIKALPGKLQAVERKNSELVAEISLLKEKSEKEATNLQEQLKAFEKQVFDLAAKLQECGGAGSGSGDVKPWMSGVDTSVPTHWVALEDLDVLNLPKNTLLTIMEGPSKPRFVQDVTTNVPVNRFYRGTFIVGVNVEELNHDKEKARFDPEFWGLYTNAGICYAARKCLVKEMSV